MLQTEQERSARRVLRRLHKERRENEGNVEKVMAARRIFRVRGDCGKGMRKEKWATLYAAADK